VVLSPALADKKGVVRAVIPFSPAEAARGGGAGTVSRNALAVPSKAVAKYIQAEAHLGKSDARRARKSLEEAVKIAPGYTAAWNFLGVLAYQERDLARAEELFRHALAIEPDAYEPTVNLGGILLALGRAAEALPLNQRAAQLRPKDPLAQGQLGVSYFRLGQLDQARPHLEEVKLVDPAHFTQPQLFLARIYERRGERALAALEIEDLLTRHPDTPDAESLRRRLRRLQAPSPVVSP
jgi:Tfp pilus assembly protein PilF